MSIIDFYEKHLERKPTALEIHNLMSSFNIGIHIKNPNAIKRAAEKQIMKLRFRKAKTWIIENSNLLKNKKDE